MPIRRSLIPDWDGQSWLALKGIDQDLASVEADVAALKANGGSVGSGASTWDQISGKPMFANVAYSGSYADLSGAPDMSVYAKKDNPTFTGTVTGVTKAMVGLANVENTSDAQKTFSAAQITGGTIDPARLGPGVASADKVLWGDGWRTLPTQSAAGSGVVRQAANGAWPTIVRAAGATYRWQPATVPITIPTAANGAAPGDEIIGFGIIQ